MQLLSVGYVQQMNQNQIYALPTSRVLFFTDAVTPTIQTSDDPGFGGTPVAVTLTNGQAELAASFIRVTSAGPINVSLKKF